MRIDEKKCIGCGICIPYCPVTAISIQNRVAVIDQDQCLECGNCIRERVVKCPGHAIYEPEENRNSVRRYRRFFSDPSVSTPTGIAGRGTEEVKTNDVTGRVCRGELGIAVEMGRPCLGTKLSELEKVFAPLAQMGVHFEECNPTTQILEDQKSGKVREDLREEKVVSAIIETKIPIEQAEEVLKKIKEIAGEIDTVFSLDVICCYDEDGTLPILPVLQKLGMPPRMNGKVNLGMGRPYKICKEKGGN
ncbi:4Fe-4S binding protein [Clostridium sp. AM58-1XD]|uniref:DUF362 domain-containing protein n=1 Tax=Clostridium sp. AM58-1XD TaxID=2292307 RepID=UPI000E514241|nr:4Fe-4S binding protein [Clostridium sp. AM58-1XD]RGZ00601.1 4Fe-4S dicluster domain-containing protein [Clostridium sp. AM58-1XD]